MGSVNVKSQKEAGEKLTNESEGLFYMMSLFLCGYAIRILNQWRGNDITRKCDLLESLKKLHVTIRKLDATELKNAFT